MRVVNALRDSWILTQRSLKHIVKNLDQLLGVIIMPIMFLLLWRYVFGGAIDTGDTSYVNFLVAGILVQTLAFGASNTAINLVMDLNRGIVDRLRSLPIFSSALLIGHVTADLVRNTLSGAVLLAFSFIIGFRPTATFSEWLLVFGILLLFTFAMSWLSAIIGLMAKSMEAVQWLTFVLIMPLTFASSAFVPTDSMAPAIKAFAENQPFTHVIESIRALLVGTPLGNSGLLAIVWCVGIIVISMPLATLLFKRTKQQK